MYVQCNIETRSCNHPCKGKAKTITYSECVSVTLGIQHAMRICIFHGLSSSAAFFTLCHKWHDFRKKKLNIKCVSETLLIPRRIQRDTVINVQRSSSKVSLYLNETIIYSIDFREILKYEVSCISVHREPNYSMQTGGQTRRS